MYAIPSTTAALPTLIPGPFILLLLLPAIPLLLFSVGARPPDTSALPFTTNDLWRTSVFVTVAGAIVLCLGVYPDVATEMGRWVVNGGYYGAPVKPLTQARLGHSKLAMPGVARGWTGVQDARRPPVGWPVVPGRLPNHLGFPAHPFIADHLFHLRNGIFANWYNPSTMSLLTTLLLSCVLALVLIVLVGKLIGSGYDTDIAMRVSSSSSSSSSTSTSTSSSSSTSDIIQREIAKRQNEKPEETLKRVQAEKRIARLDSKSRATLVQYLERKGLNLAGLDDSEAEPKGDETKDDESKKSDEVKPAKTLQRLQRKLLGKGLYNGLQKKKQETTAAGGATTDRASLQTPGHVVEVTAQAQNTTDIANKLRVDMAST